MARAHFVGELATSKPGPLGVCQQGGFICPMHLNFRTDAKSRSPYSAIFKTRDFPRGLDRIGLVCFALAVLVVRKGRPGVKRAASSMVGRGPGPAPLLSRLGILEALF